MQQIGAAAVGLALAFVALGGCVRAGYAPPPLKRDGVAVDFDGAAPDGASDGASDSASDSAEVPTFDPAGNACLKADSGPFVELTRFVTPNTAYGVWYVAPHVLAASTTAGLYVLGFDGAAFSQRDRAQGVGWAEAIWSAGSTVYLSSPGSGLRAYSLAPTGKLTLLATASSALAQARRLWGDSKYLYVPSAQSLQALTFDGAAFSAPAAAVPAKKWAQGAWTDGKQIYLADNDSVRAFTFDGAKFAEVDAANLAGVNRLWGHDDVLYAGGDAGVAAYGIGAGKLAFRALAKTGAKVREVWSDGVHVFAAASDAGLYALRFTGSAFVQVGRVDTDGSSLGVVGDGTTIYLGDTKAVIAYSGFACTQVDGGG